MRQSSRMRTGKKREHDSISADSLSLKSMKTSWSSTNEQVEHPMEATRLPAQSMRVEQDDVAVLDKV